jgi:hypothetical protein
MSAFWHRGPNEPTAQLWRRCELCKWAGPNERFMVWRNERAEYISVCDHRWCTNLRVLTALHDNGWWEVAKVGPI